MKTKLITLALLGFATAAMALDRTDLDNRIQMLGEKFDGLQQMPGQRIPADTLRNAKGIIMLDRTKAGFLFAYQGGSGVAMVREHDSGKWSPAAFVSANEASLGFQVGGEQRFVVVLFMTTNATRMLTEQRIDFAGEARASANNDTSKVETQAAVPDVLVYDDRQGLYAGAAVKGNAVTPDKDANDIYYGSRLSMGDILFRHQVQPTPAAINLAQKIDEYSHFRPNTETSQR